MQSYTYSDLEADLSLLDIPSFSIGKSVNNKNIYTFTLGNGTRNVFFNGAHHGLEWLTAPVLMRFASDYIYALNNGTRLFGFDIKELYNKVKIHITPMVNPDGIGIAAFGTTDGFLININRGNDFRKNWQSNARGVDLNHNYDAGFDLCRKEEYRLGITGPGPTRYGGPHPESEPEVKAVCDYVRKNNFDLCVALHSQGEVIYYDYNGKIPKNSIQICKEMCKVSGYTPDRAIGIASYGGFKDWFIKEFNKPAYTVEIGKGKNPLDGGQLELICEKVIPLLIISSFLC